MTTPKRTTTPIDLAAIRAALASAHGPSYWRSLEELAGTPEFAAALAAEFPSIAPAADDPVGRRDFLRLMGASLALAGVTACTRQPTERIVPYVDTPENITLGKPLAFATAVVQEGFAHGVLVESHEGRPTKIEGNPAHPASKGATSAQTQAAILDLYDPDRSQSVTHAGWPSSWSAFVAAMAPELAVKKLRRGAGLRLLTGAVTSPTLAAQLRRLLALFPEAKWHQWEPLTSDAVRDGARLAFGRELDHHFRLEEAQVLVCLDSDLLHEGPGAVRYARDFAASRREGGVTGSGARLYVVEASPSITGSVADHRLIAKGGDTPAIAEALAAAICGQSAQPFLRELSGLDGRTKRWVEIVANDLLERRRGSTVIAVGPTQPPEVHALAHLMNERLGNSSRTVIYTEPVEARAGADLTSLTALCADIEAGAVDLLFVIDSNPVYSAPAELELGRLLQKVAIRARLGLYEDETSALCHWHLPRAHALESWGDGRAFDGSVTIMQPLIAPLYGGKTAHELVAVLSGEPSKSDYVVVQEYWKERWGKSFSTRWGRSLNDGIVAESAEPPLDVKVLAAPGQPLTEAPPRAAGLELLFRPDASIRDGAFANNGWLQELAKPLTKLTWENAALVSPALAERLHIATGDEVRLELRGRSLVAPVFVLPGQAADTVTIHLGYGRTRAGKVGNGMGFDANLLRRRDALWSTTGLSLTPTGKQTVLATTQSHHSMEGRALVRSATVRGLAADQDTPQKWEHDPEPGLSLYPPHEYRGNAWGMSIDLSACIGCNACVIACQAENNIAVVGKEQVSRGREMAWLRIDRYFEGALDAPAIVNQPVACQHCEQAPCEPVCPVGATVHSAEGLNEMVYNRCVGTRYCSNNCPYKVRRFNFLLYSDFTTESLKAQRNPNVTVRSRGVMEKCTYCVQRINVARIAAKKESRAIRDGEIETACAAACPTRAITFGNLNDSQSKVAGLRKSPLAYSLLGEIGTRPRTSYLAIVRNPNPEMEKL